MPVTTATVERSFSTLRRLKTYLQNTMGEKRVTALALININSSINIDVNEVLTIFKQKSRRVDF